LFYALNEVHGAPLFDRESGLNGEVV
jgi:hypothetical protein